MIRRKTLITQCMVIQQGRRCSQRETTGSDTETRENQWINFQEILRSDTKVRETQGDSPRKARPDLANRGQSPNDTGGLHGSSGGSIRRTSSDTNKRYGKSGGSRRQSLRNADGGYRSSEGSTVQFSSGNNRQIMARFNSKVEIKCCSECGGEKPSFTDDNTKLFCGKSCQKKYYDVSRRHYIGRPHEMGRHVHRNGSSEKSYSNTS
jgi:hypothetical protein